MSPVNGVSVVERNFGLFRRDCVECPPETPSCPQCAEDEICSQIPQSCDKCASRQCIKNSSLPSQDPVVSSTTSKGPNVGAIAGGVIGGIVFIAIATFLVWKFCLKGRRHHQEDYEEDWSTEIQQAEKDDFTMRRDARASTHTVASMASTVLTRASNIIQIAYIPGITNRSNAHSPGLLVPPVPPIPIATTDSSPGSPYSGSESHYFMPGDLRDSTYSGYSDATRDSAYRNSIAPSLARSLARDSVATTIYRSNAVVSPTPAQTVVRGKAAVVSVKSSEKSTPVGTPDAETPPMPSLDHGRFGRNPQVKVLGSAGPSPKGSLNSLKGNSPATLGKPIALDIIKRKPSTSSPLATSAHSTPGSEASEKKAMMTATVRPVSGASTDTDDSGDERDPARRGLLSPPATATTARDSAVTEIADTPTPAQGPFGDENKVATSMSGSPAAPSSPASSRRKLGVVQEEAAGPSEGRARSPFGDENEVGRRRA